MNLAKNITYSGIFLICIFFYACKKDIVRSTTANLLVINASPNSSTINFLQNLKPLGSFNYITGLNPPLSSVTIDSGFHNYKLQNGGNEIASWLYSNRGFHYSLFVYDSASANRVKYFFTQDNLDTVGLGRQCKLRFMHLAPDLDSLDIVTPKLSNPAQDSSIAAYSNLKYMGTAAQAQIQNASVFNTFPGDTAITLRIRRRIDNSTARSYTFNFVKGKVYSLVVKGYNARSGRDSLSMSIITHN